MENKSYNSNNNNFLFCGGGGGGRNFTVRVDKCKTHKTYKNFALVSCLDGNKIIERLMDSL